jgi:hypothetical protein
MRHYDHKDFIANPDKYTGFKTATIAKNVFTLNGELDLREGDFVSVEFSQIARNQLYGREEPIYRVRKSLDGPVIACLYGNAMADFVL